MKGKQILFALIIGGAAFLLSLLLYFTRILDPVEFISSDLRQQVFLSTQKASDEVVLVLIDQGSLDWMESNFGISWPWDRSLYSYFIRYAQTANAKALGFDILFDSHSRIDAEEDTKFGKAVTAWPYTVFAATYSNDKPEQEYSSPSYLKTITVDTSKISQIIKDRNFRILYPKKFPIDEIALNAKYICSVIAEQDSDAINRRANLIYQSEGKFIPNFALALFLCGQDTEPVISASDKSITINDKTFPLDNNGKSVIRFKNKTGRVTVYSAQQIINSMLQIDEGLAPDIDPDLLKNKYIIIGTSAEATLDLRPLPFNAKAGGFDVHAGILENMITGSFVIVLPVWFDILILFLLSFSIAFAGLKANNAVKTAVLMALCILIPVGSGFGLFAINIMITMIYFLFTAVMTWLATAIFNYATEGAQKRYIKSAFQQYLSPAWIEQLIHDKDNLKLGGDRRELTIFFSDIQGFTSISEILSPEDLTSLLNEFLTAMTDIIMETGGTIDKYEGDAIIAFWNAPLSLEDHAVRGVQATLLCQKKLAELRPLLRERAGRDLYMRVGLNTGNAVVGNMGSNMRFDFTMLGDSVNLAARLEGINKQYGTYKMASSMTALKTGSNFSWRELSKVAVVGKKEPVTVLEPFFHEDFEAQKDLLLEFERGLHLYYAGKFKEAIQIFGTIKDQDPPSNAYFERCTELLKNPPADFNGVWIMTSK